MVYEFDNKIYFSDFSDDTINYTVGRISHFYNTFTFIAKNLGIYIRLEQMLADFYIPNL